MFGDEEILIKELGFRRSLLLGKDGSNQTDFQYDADKEQEIPNIRLGEYLFEGINVVLMPGPGDTPRVEHIGFFLDESEMKAAMKNASRMGLRIIDRQVRQFATSSLGFRIEFQGLPKESSSFQSTHFSRIVLEHKKPEKVASYFSEIFSLEVKVSDGEWKMKIGNTAFSIRSGNTSLKLAQIKTRFQKKASDRLSLEFVSG